ncbi:MAG TPA: hypothetical protein VMM13_13020 [Euzebya sp.]|nr:hypothetical protein [Euzebya sp.]
MGVVVALLLIMLAAWMYREYTESRRRKAVEATPVRSAPPPPHQRVSDRELDRQLRSLRGAIADGSVTEDEAVGSLVRTAGLAADDARARLRRRS